MLANTIKAVIDKHGRCPSCNANWDAGAIFDVLRPQDWCKDKSDAELQAHIDQCYGAERPQRFSRLVGISSRELDRVVAWQCPDCETQWPRV